MQYRRILFLFLLAPLWLNAQVQERPQVLVGTLTATTGPLRDWKPDLHDPALGKPTRDEKGLLFARDLQPLVLSNYGSRHHGEDPLLQKHFGRPAATGPTNQAYGRTVNPASAIERDGGTLGQSINGIPYTSISPADPTLAVGPSHLLQMVNGPSGAQFQVFDRSGTALTTLAYFQQLPGASFKGGGDCMAWYDQLEGRFVMSEFGDSAKTGSSINTLIIAVSATGDPTGSWYIYEFSNASFFPDYPKYANWTDAWYGVTRDFLGSYAGNSVWAFNKAKMIAGAAAPEMQRVRLTDPDNKYNSLCPVSLYGTTPPPAGTPGLFMYFNDNDYTSSPTDADSIGIISFHVDFADPSKSVVKVERSLAVAPFKSNVCNTRSCAPSPSGAGYDVISDRIMNKPWYRNFGGHEDIVLNHTVDADGNALSALRWYQLRRTGPTWNLSQQGTFSPQDKADCSINAPIHRFMGAIGINGAGQLALAYNSSGLTRNASISFTGRNDGDPANLMTYAETDAVIGKAYGTFSSRWGDYNDLQPDVTDDSLFWFTAMYGDSAFKWKTKILSFRLRPNLNLDARLVSIDQPNDCNNPCTLDIQPLVTIRNLGNSTLRDLDVYLSVNGVATSLSHWSGNLPISTETSYALPLTNLSPGTNTLRIFLSNPNGGTDQNPINDTLSVTVTVGASAPLPLQEGFEGLLFPSNAWTTVSDGSATYHWSRSTAAAHSGSASIWVNNYQTNEPGKRADLRSPVLDISAVDSADLSFHYAAGLVSPDKLDTLEVLVSTDCGKSFISLWKRWGESLSTRSGYSLNPYIPTAQEWRKVTLDLTPYRQVGRVILAFRNINAFGNNIWLDDIRVETVGLPRHDATAYALESPNPIVCDPSIQPRLRIVNVGKDTLTSLVVGYRIDAGPLNTVPWTGSLARLEGATVSLPTGTLPSFGDHVLTLFTSAPNGQADEHVANDTLRVMLGHLPTLDLPLTEGFENTAFPPTGWFKMQDTRITGWQRYTGVVATGQAAAYMNNFADTARQAMAVLVTPQLRTGTDDSVFFDMNLSAATLSYPGSTELPLDTLDISVSTDCGSNFISVYRKWGAELQTLGDPNQPHPTAFYPTALGQWRLEHVNLTDAVAGSSRFLVRLQCTSNHENNIFIDDVHVYAENLPDRLKQEGYLVNPNPFKDRTLVRFHPDASKVLGMELYNAAGQLLRKYDYTSGNAPASQELSLGNLPAGLYALRIRFQDRTVTQKLVKQ